MINIHKKPCFRRHVVVYNISFIGYRYYRVVAIDMLFQIFILAPERNINVNLFSFSKWTFSPFRHIGQDFM